MKKKNKKIYMPVGRDYSFESLTFIVSYFVHRTSKRI